MGRSGGNSFDTPKIGTPEPRIVAAVSGTGQGDNVVTLAASLATSLGATWHAIFIETPRSARRPAIARRAAEALSQAARQGATVSNEPAADVIAGLASHLAAMPADHLVLGAPAPSRRRLARTSTLDSALAQFPGLTVHIASTATALPIAPLEPTVNARAGWRQHMVALSLVAVTLVIAGAASVVLSGRALNLLFLFPVIAAAARFGLGPALTATAASVLGFDFFLLQPRYHLQLTAPASLILLAALSAIAIYTSLLTGALRSRVALSDRSSQENARIATFSQLLARVSTWEETAQLICDELAGFLNAQAIVFREKDGRMVRAAASSQDYIWGAVDQAALDWCWMHGEAAGRGTTSISSADWRVEPLRTSLGVLAVLALARPDGRDPVRADRGVLYSTLVSLAAIANERLILEDRIRKGELP